MSDGRQIVAYGPSTGSLLPKPVKPLPVTRLEPNTNLNVPPLALWIGQGTYSGAWRSYYNTDSHRDYLRSIKLATTYIDAVGAVDLVAEAETLKKLLLLPFAGKSSSFLLHKIGKTLLIDNCEYLCTASKCKEGSSSKVATFLSPKSLSRLGVSNDLCTEVDTDLLTYLREKMLVDHLYTRSIADTKPSKIENESAVEKVSRTVHKTELDFSEALNENGLCDPLEENGYANFKDDGNQAEFDAFGRIWNFYDLKILVDVGLPIFGCKTNPCITLHPKDTKHRPINFLTGVDLYLDQSMCNAPEALLCWHSGGFVKEYEVIRTEDIPHLENSKFDPNVLQNIAKNIISFLQDNVAKEGHTYWLLHDKGDEEHEPILRLWDLTPLCGDLLEDSTANPFTLSVGILIYKVARNLMRRSASKRPKRIANAAYRLLNVCLGIIDREKHPQVIACVHYLLANLYLSYGHDAIKRTEGDEEELERNEPLWAFDDRWQQEYGEEYGSYAAISVESLKQKNFGDQNRKKPPKLRPLPNCSSMEDCYKQSLEHCYEGLRCMKTFEQQQDMRLKGNPLSFTRNAYSPTVQDREETDDISLQLDVYSILLIRAATAYCVLADGSFILSRYGRTLRFCRVGILCCLAVVSLNAHRNTKSSLRNLATARALLPALMCHTAEAIGNIACSSSAVKDRDEGDLKKCYRDMQLESLARIFLKGDFEYEWAFPTVLNTSSLTQFDIADRAAKLALALSKKIVALSIFPPTATAIMLRNDIARRIGNLKNCLGMRYITRLKMFVIRAAKATALNDKDALSQYVAVELGFIDHDVAVSPETLIKEVVEAGTKLLLEGVELFRKADDSINEAFLLSNIGQLYYLQLHSYTYLSEFSEEFSCEHEKKAALTAMEYYQKALNCSTLKRSSQFPLFESISRDLALAYYTYGVRLQDNFYSAKDFEKMASEVKHYITKALSAFELIRNSKRCSKELHTNAEQHVTLIYYRLATLAQSLAKQVANAKKKREYNRSSEEYYSKCIRNVQERIERCGMDECSLRECFTAIRAKIESLKSSTNTFSSNNKGVKLKYYQKLSRLLLFETLLVLKCIKHRTEPSRINELEEMSSRHDLKFCGDTLNHFICFAQMIVKETFQCVLESAKQSLIDEWKAFYYKLLVEGANKNFHVKICGIIDLIEKAKNILNI